MTGSIKEQRYLVYFILSILVLIACAGVSCGIESQKGRSAAQAYTAKRVSVETEEVYLAYTSSGQRVVEFDTLEYVEPEGMRISEDDYEVLCRIVQAEAGCEDMRGKILVANVVLNRVKDGRFPDTVKEVVFQYSGNTAQFSPVADGSYSRVTVTEETMEAVDRALQGEDYSEGALYFAARSAAGEEKMRWFDQCLTKLFAYGGHEFFL